MESSSLGKNRLQPRFALRVLSASLLRWPRLLDLASSPLMLMYAYDANVASMILRPRLLDLAS